MIKNSFNFTEKTLLKIKPPETKRNVYRDTKEKGLILMVSYGGSKVFYLGKRIKPKYYRIKLGVFPDMSVMKARAEAVELKAQIAKGINPVEKQTTAEIDKLTFKLFFDRYINDYAKHNTKSWRADVAEMDKKAKNLYNKEITIITRNDIQKIFNEITSTGKYAANRFLDRVKAIFNKAIEWELLEKNPSNGIKKHKEKSRDRYITSEEEERFFKAVTNEKNQVMKDFILMALYTAARKGNVLAMRWNDINLSDRTWHIPDTKNGEPQLIPLIPEAIIILQSRYQQSSSEWVFPSSTSKTGHLQEPKKAWRRICKEAELSDLRIHDLRRTMGSWMAIAGASQYVIGKALNHKSPSSTAIYAKLSLDPVRDFMGKATHIFNKNKLKKVQ